MKNFLEKTLRQNVMIELISTQTFDHVGLCLRHDLDTGYTDP